MLRVTGTKRLSSFINKVQDTNSYLLFNEFYFCLREYYYKKGNETSIHILISKELKVPDLKTLETKDIFMYHNTELHSL